MGYEYKVVQIREGLVGGKMSAGKLESVLNEWAAKGWQLKAVTAVEVKGRLGPGGTEGVLGSTASWIVGLVMAAIAVLALLSGRRAKRRHGFAVKPVWAEGVLMALIVGAILGFVAVLNPYPIAETKLRRAFEAWRMRQG